LNRHGPAELVIRDGKNAEVPSISSEAIESHDQAKD